MAPCPLWLSPNPMRCIITIALVLCLTFTPCYALTLFTTDYDSDQYTELTLSFSLPNNVPEGWLPLRAAAEYLPISVDWDNATREIIVRADLYKSKLSLLKEKRYKIDNLNTLYADDLMIVNGVTYCSPKFLTIRLPNVSFRYNGEVYYLKGEAKTSTLIQGDESFRNKVLTTMYNLKLALPEDYSLIRSCLTGGIKQVSPEDADVFANAYVYPSRRNPVAYIVGGEYADIANLIAHEGYHVWLERNEGQSEKEAREYGQMISNRLNEMRDEGRD